MTRFDQIPENNDIALGNDVLPAGMGPFPWSGVIAPAGYLMADGAPYSRTTYANLFNAITVQFANAGTTNGSTSVTVGAQDVSKLRGGMPVSGPGIPLGATVSSTATGTPNTITLSNAATGTATITLVVAPHGVGDGATTFNVPDMRGVSPIGADDMLTAAGAANRVPTDPVSGRAMIIGARGGEARHAIAVAEMPSHNHGGNTGGRSADHTHSPPNAGPPYSPGEFLYANYGTVWTNEGQFTVDGNAKGSGNPQQILWYNTTVGASGDHSHGISAQGGGSAANVLHPVVAHHWIIKV